MGRTTRCVKRNIDQARANLAAYLCGETKAFQGARPQPMNKYIGLRQKCRETLLA
jgi:hypothetical protein